MGALDASGSEKQLIAEHTERQMADVLADPGWSPRQQLALAARALARDGHSSGLAGQITARADEPGSYWTLGFGLGFDEASASAMIRIDDELRVIEGHGMANPATRFHLWIYRARAHVRCIVHTHPPYASALSMVGEPLVIAHMDSTPLYEDCAYLADYPGVPVADEEGRIISQALGAKRAILLGHHGLLTACDSIAEATMLAIFMERACALQLRARAIGEIKPIRPEHGRESHDFLLRPKITGATFNYFARQVLRKSPETLQ